jgi:phosphinothricin acetyltransferase
MGEGERAPDTDPAVVVRDAIEDDLPATLDIYNELIPTTTIAWTEELQTLDERRAWFAEQRRRWFPVLVAVEGEDVIGTHVLVAAIDATNTDSLAFHERLGFVEVGRMPETGFKFGRWLDLVLMQRVIGA